MTLHTCPASSSIGVLPDPSFLRRGGNARLERARVAVHIRFSHSPPSQPTTATMS